MGDSKAQESPTPTSLREQIRELIRLTMSHHDYVCNVQELDIDPFEKLVASYVEAAEIDVVLGELEKVGGQIIQRILDGSSEYLKPLKDRVNELEAQKAVLEKK